MIVDEPSYIEHTMGYRPMPYAYHPEVHYVEDHEQPAEKPHIWSHEVSPGVKYVQVPEALFDKFMKETLKVEDDGKEIKPHHEIEHEHHTEVHHEAIVHYDEPAPHHVEKHETVVPVHHTAPKAKTPAKPKVAAPH